MKYIIFILIFCIIISIVFSNIKIRDKKEKFYTDSELDLILEDECKNKKNIKENYYSKSELDLILYDIKDVCKIKTFKGQYNVNVYDPDTLELINQITIDPKFIREYNLNDDTRGPNNKNKFGEDTLPPITEQGVCGCCFAYTLAAMLYYDFKINKTSNLRVLSAKHLTDCLSLQSNKTCTEKYRPCNGCGGCSTPTILKYYFNSPQKIFFEDCYKSDILKCKIEDGSDAYKYLGKPCRFDRTQTYQLYDFVPCDNSSCFLGDFITTPGYDLLEIKLPSSSNKSPTISPANIEIIKKAIYGYSPLQFTYKGARDPEFNDYDGGICNAAYVNTEGTHSLMIIGWKKIGSIFKKECWIVRNSWGTDWGTSTYSKGQKGYVFFPTNLNIFYGEPVATLRGIIRQRPCIPPPLTFTGKEQITSTIEIREMVKYTKQKSTCKILARAFTGISLSQIDAIFSIISRKIDSSINHEDNPPMNIADCGNSKPKFYVDRNNNICNDQGNKVIMVAGNYYDNIDGINNNKNFDLNINRYFFYELDIDIDNLLYNTKWLFTINFTDPYDNDKILSNSSIEINWDLKIIINDSGQYIDQAASTPSMIYYIKFEVLVPINERFNLLVLTTTIVDNFPNNNIFPDNGSSVIPNFAPDTGNNDSLPLNPGVYYYINTDPNFPQMKKSLNYIDDNQKAISVNII
jgi:hypothetical protein